MAKKRGPRSAPLRLQGDVPTRFASGQCTGCLAEAKVGMALTNWGVITLCKNCLSKAIAGSQGEQPKVKSASKWASTDVLDHRVAGSPGTGKRR
jgi:hypothetical protein